MNCVEKLVCFVCFELKNWLLCCGAQKKLGRGREEGAKENAFRNGSIKTYYSNVKSSYLGYQKHSEYTWLKSRQMWNRDEPQNEVCGYLFIVSNLLFILWASLKKKRKRKKKNLRNNRNNVQSGITFFMTSKAKDKVCCAWKWKLCVLFMSIYFSLPKRFR